MEYCSRQCIRRTLYAVSVGISPIVICLLLIALVRFILYCLETIYYRRQQISRHRRRSSSFYYQTGRSTLSYTPVSLTELQRIIQGDYQSPRLSQTSLEMENHNNNNNDSPKQPKFIKSILTRRESLAPSSTNTLANLVIRRNALSSTPFTALFAPVSTPVTPILNIINEQKLQRQNSMNIKHESIETTTKLSPINNQFYDTNDISECDPLLTSSKSITTTTTTNSTTVVGDEFLDFHSVCSIPYSLNLVNSILENNF